VRSQGEEILQNLDKTLFLYKEQEAWAFIDSSWEEPMKNVFHLFRWQEGLGIRILTFVIYRLYPP
jgi:hypothetical protein